MKNIFESLECNWDSILCMLPVDLDQSAFAYGALLRKREIRSGADLLRLVLASCWSGFSQRTVATWSSQTGIANIANTSLRERLIKCAEWMEYLLTAYLKERNELHLDAGRLRRIRLADASCVSRPGCTQPDWWVHTSFDLGRMCCDFMQLTDCKGSEHLGRFTGNSGELFIGDRQYGHRGDVYSATSTGSDVIVRLAKTAIPLTTMDGKKINMIEAAAVLAEEEVLDITVLTVPDATKDIPAIKGRLVIKRKSRQDEQKSVDKLTKKKRKAGKKITPGALEACRYIFLFTTLGEEIPASDILGLYRFRWQIEIAFKRMKSVMHLDELTVTDDEMCRTIILGKLLAVLLVEDLTEKMRSFSPCEERSEEIDTGMAIAAVAV